MPRDFSPDEQGTALPNNVNIFEELPLAVRSFSRRVKCMVTSAQSWTENQYIKIGIDTAIPGAFLDPLQTYLKADITFTNKNPYIDFVNFGVCGAHGFIDEFRIIQQGTPLEEIINYPSVVETYMDLAGVNTRPYNMYRECELDLGVERSYIQNAIKPPMVSMMGNPMYYNAAFSENRNQQSFWGKGSASYNYPNKPFLLGTTAAGNSIHSYVVMTGATQYNTATPTADVANAYATGNPNNPAQIISTAFAPAAGTGFGFNSRGQSGNKNTINQVDPEGAEETKIQQILARYKRPVPLDIPGFILGRRNASGLGYGIMYGAPSGVQANATMEATSLLTSLPETTNCMDSNYYPVVETVDTMDGQLIHLAGQQPACTLFGSASMFLENAGVNPSNPLNWPFCMPNDQAGGKVIPITQNLPNYHMFLSNVKRIPVGIKGSARASAGDQATYVASTDTATLKTNPNFANVTAITSAVQTFTTTVCIPLFSGIFGGLATKCSPTMLQAPGSLYIDIKTAPASRAFQVTMDPCRRVLGTVRDYVPFGGSIGGVFGQFNYVSPYGVANDYTTNWTSTKTINAMLQSQLSAQVYLPYNSGLQTSNVPVAQTPWASNAYFGVGSGAIYSPLANSVNNTITTASNTLFQTNKPNLGGYFSCIGANLMALQRYLTLGATSDGISGNGVSMTTSLDLIFSPYSPAAMSGRDTIYNVISETNQMQGVYTTYYNPKRTYANDAAAATAQVTRYVLNTSSGVGTYGETIITDDITASVPISTGTTSGTADIVPQPFSGSINMYTNAGDAESARQALGTSTMNTAIISGSHLPVSTFGNSQQCYLGNDDSYALQYVGEQEQQYIAGYALSTDTTVNDNQYSQGVSTRGARFSGIKSGGNRLISQSCITQRTGITTGGPGYNGSGQQVDALANDNEPMPMWTPMTTQTLTMMGGPSGVPKPQYCLVNTPWSRKALYVVAGDNSGLSSGKIRVYGASVTSDDLCSESYGCFGTKLDKSTDQSFRCFNQLNGSTNYVAYTISNVELISQQIILPEAVISDILQMAATQDISILTNMVRAYQSPLSTGSQQNIIVPAKAASANSLIAIFQPQNYSSTTEAQLYNSYSRFCPFSKIYSTDTFAKTTATAFEGATSLYNYELNSQQQYAVGQATPFSYVNCPAYNSAFSMQYQLGVEMLPQQPITTIQEVIGELQKMQHKLFDSDANTNCLFQLTPSSGYIGTSSQTYGSVTDFSDDLKSGYAFYDSTIDGGFTTAFCSAAFLDDQAIINNPAWNYIAACAYNANVSASAPSSAAAALAAAKGVGSVGQAAYGVSKLFGARGPHVLPFYKPPECKWMFGLDLDTWSKNSNVARSGRFLGQNTIQFQISNAPALDFSNSSQKTNIQGLNMWTIVQYDARLSYQAGGSTVTYY